MTEPRTPDTDPILALLPAERPLAFDQLALDEQAWRARAYLMAYSIGMDPIHAWWWALQTGPRADEVRASVAEATDDQILAALRSGRGSEAWETQQAAADQVATVPHETFAVDPLTGVGRVASICSGDR